MPTTTAPRLSASEVDHYRRHGYVLPTGQILPDDDFAGLVAHFEGILARSPEGTRPEHLDVPHFADPGLFRWLFHDAVLDLVEPLIGPDIALFASHFICKPGGDGKRVPWHEDSAYWQKVFSPEDMQVVTVWLALDRSTAANGAMRVIPDTHRGGYSDYDPVADPAISVFGTEIRKDLCQADRAVTIELAPNQASLHHAKLMHGSNRNTSPDRRCAYTMRYISTRSRFQTEYCGGSHGLYLARGRDHAGNTYLDPGKPAPELIAQRAAYIRKGH